MALVSIKIPNFKHQITNKSQISISNDQNNPFGYTVSARSPFSACEYTGYPKYCRIMFDILNFWSLEFI
jgi:hypothetical protein